MNKLTNINGERKRKVVTKIIMTLSRGFRVVLFFVLVSVEFAINNSSASN